MAGYEYVIDLKKTGNLFNRVHSRDIVFKADSTLQMKRPRKSKCSRLEFHFLSGSLLSPSKERLESSILDHNSRTRVEVEEVSLYRWNKDGKFFVKHLLLRVSVASLSSLLPAGQTD